MPSEDPEQSPPGVPAQEAERRWARRWALIAVLGFLVITVVTYLVPGLQEPVRNGIDAAWLLLSLGHGARPSQ
ncbi:hypothetical protein [Streptomyces klenkii]